MAVISVKKKMRLAAAMTVDARDAANPAAPVLANVVAQLGMRITWATPLAASAGAAVKAKHRDRHKSRPKDKAGRAMQWVAVARVLQHHSRAAMDSRVRKVSAVVRAPVLHWVRPQVKAQGWEETRNAADVADRLRKAHSPAQSAWPAGFHAGSRVTRRAIIAAASAPHSAHRR